MAPPGDLQHQVTAGCHPLSLGHTCGPRDAPGILWARSCSPAQLQRFAVVGARRASHPASCGFRLPNLRCLQCPALGISKGLCAFRNVDYPETFASEGSSLGISGEEGWLDAFGTCRKVGDGFMPPRVGRGGAWSRFQFHSSRWEPASLHGRDGHPVVQAVVLSEMGTLRAWPRGCYTARLWPVQASTSWDSPWSLELFLPHSGLLIPTSCGEGGNG